VDFSKQSDGGAFFVVVGGGVLILARSQWYVIISWMYSQGPSNEPEWHSLSIFCCGSMFMESQLTIDVDF